MKPGTEYSGVFLVDRVVPKQMRSQKEHYLSVTLVDVTGRIEGVIWNYNNTNVVKSGQYIHLEITTKIYREQLHFNAKGRSVQPFSGTPANIEDYVRSLAEPVLDYYEAELREALTDLDDPEYIDMLHEDVDLVATLRQAPYGQDGPLAHPGGLLVHTTHTLRLALNAVKECADVDGIKTNRSLIILGTVLRNIGWSTTTVLEGKFIRPRDAFYMTGVHSASARYVDHLMQSVEAFKNITLNESKKQALHNLCADIDDIRTLEGKIIAWAGEMAGLMHGFGYTMNLKQEGNWRGDFFVGHL